MSAERLPPYAEPRGLLQHPPAADAILGETCGVLREVSGEYREPSLFFSSRIFPSAEILNPIFSIRKANGPGDNSSTSVKDAGLGGSSLVRRAPPNG